MSINPRITQKQVKEGYGTIAYCGYCDLQYTLKDARKVGHTARKEGWAANIYEITPSICIVTGYAPFGNKSLPLALTASYERKAKELYNGSTTTPRDKLQVLWAELAKDIETL